ncbi:MAG TPA: TIGR01212 family radical SAM protein [Bacteroidales bacterium]|nr:TIGR01212 family radical SAM protein [Bacteroidales bacterium]
MHNNKEERVFPWGHNRRFNAYSNYFRKKYGARIQKVSIDAGFTCPNRDGTKSTGGCSFCLNDAFNPSYCLPSKPVSRQISEGIEFHRKRYSEAASYLAYFQAFSNTYAPVEFLKKVYEEALSVPGIAGLIIGTRPDCIDDKKLEYIRSISDKHYVAIEYGVESCYDRTLSRINRGHTFEEAEETIKRTASLGITTGAHFIFGLPGESITDMLAEADIISSLPLTTVKFHQLQIIKGTAIEKEYERDPSDFTMFSLEKYIEFFINFLERLNPSIVVERFTGEAPPRFLDKIRWGKKRTDQIVDLIEKSLEERDTWQGRLWNGAGLRAEGREHLKTKR